MSPLLPGAPRRKQPAAVLSLTAIASNQPRSTRSQAARIAWRAWSHSSLDSPRFQLYSSCRSRSTSSNLRFGKRARPCHLRQSRRPSWHCACRRRPRLRPPPSRLQSPPRARRFPRQLTCRRLQATTPPPSFQRQRPEMPNRAAELIARCIPATCRSLSCRR